MSIDLLAKKEFWSASPEEVLAKLETSLDGLSEKELTARKKLYGPNTVHKNETTLLSIFLRQFTGNPLILILAAATFVSYLLGQKTSSYYIFGLIMLSVLLGLFNEYSAEKTVDLLLKKISHNSRVIRGGEKKEVPAIQLTVGDIVVLSPGDVIPADVRLIEAKNLELNQSALTGESKTVFKNSEALEKSPTSATELSNICFMGTTVQSGSGQGVVIQIGRQTEFGQIAHSVTFLKPTTEFQKGITKFGNLVIRFILILTTAIFIINAWLGHPLLDSALFSLAIAVGLTPELLPVIVTVSLSHGAGKLAKKHVIAKQLIAIENLGSMDILCADKTGTLTEGKIVVVEYMDAHGAPSPEVLQLSIMCNDAVVHHKVVGNGIDVALWTAAQNAGVKLPHHLKKIDAVPFDFDQKAMYTVTEENGERLLIVKGAPQEILAFCKAKTHKEEFHQKCISLYQNGFRVIAVASKKIAAKEEYSWKDVEDLDLKGYVTFLDTPKKTAKDALLKLHQLRVGLKVITGDNEIITRKICDEVGMENIKIITGAQMEKLSDAELKKTVEEADVFGRVSPEQKLRIIQTLRANGHTVGFLGDGINDIPSLHSADVGISVDTGVDVAKNAASIVLLNKSLNTIADGVIEGRKTFANTIKYILMASSSNFGNMFSAAGASFFLPFLPMTPVQILLTNGLYDFSQLALPSDNVDPESLLSPRHWNINFIRNYMLFFGPLSSIFDYLTFAIMIFIFHAQESMFQTGWFVESLATQILVVFVIRTARTPFFLSKPSPWLILSSVVLVGIAFLLPISPFAAALHLTPLPLPFFAALLLLIVGYLSIVEIAKKIFLHKYPL